MVYNRIKDPFSSSVYIHLHFIVSFKNAKQNHAWDVVTTGLKGHVEIVEHVNIHNNKEPLNHKLISWYCCTPITLK